MIFFILEVRTQPNDVTSCFRRSPNVHEMNLDSKPTTNVQIIMQVHQLFKIRVSALADAAWASTLVVPRERGTCGSAQLLLRGEQGRTHSGLYRGGGAAVSLPSLLKLFSSKHPGNHKRPCAF